MRSVRGGRGDAALEPLRKQGEVEVRDCSRSVKRHAQQLLNARKPVAHRVQVYVEPQSLLRDVQIDCEVRPLRIQQQGVVVQLVEQLDDLLASNDLVARRQ
jgi:hypothetical protein